MLAVRERDREFDALMEKEFPGIEQRVPGRQGSVPPVTAAEWEAARTVTLGDLLTYLTRHGIETAEYVAILALAAFVSGLPALYIIYRVLPRRQTNAFYLRAFRNDAATLGVRKTIQRTLGYRQFRLSGIRDPRRRGSPFLRGVYLFVLAIRYSTPKYMDLEAGDDWKARLWRSLADARCAFIDVSDPTPFLEEEVVLTVRCLGPRRVLFVADGSRDEDAWRQCVAGMVEPNAPESGTIEVAVWGAGAERRRAFADKVRRFAAALPEGNVGLSANAAPLIRESLEMQESGRDDDGAFWTKIVLGMLFPFIWMAALGVLGQALNPSPVLAFTLFIASLLPAAVALAIFIITLIMYMIERGFD